MTLKGYQKHIQEASECTDAEAPEVEELMRDIYGTLDNISAATFRREARKGLKDLRTLRKSDPTWSRIVKQKTARG